MLLSTTGSYILVALIAGVAGYVIAHRKGLNAVGWGWASLLLIVPIVILLFVRPRRASDRSQTVPDETWHALLAYDPALKAAAARLAPFGAPAMEELRRAWAMVPDKAALPDMVAAIQARWLAHANTGLIHVETREGVAVLRDAAGCYQVDGRQTADLATARLMAAAYARRKRTPPVTGLLAGAIVIAGVLSGTDPAKAQSDAADMTLPSCERYQRERPRGGSFEQLSELFGLSIYRWNEADYGRYRTLMIDCKLSLPGFRADVTVRDWEAATEKTVTGLKSYTGFVNRLGEPMANRYGPRPQRGEPDTTLSFQALSCDRFTRQTINAWAHGGAPDYRPDAPFSVPLANWTYEVWRAFGNRVANCVQLPGSEAETERDWLSTLVSQQEARNEVGIRQAQQDAVGARTKLAGILLRAMEADGLSSADDITSKLKAVEALAAAGPKLGRADEEQAAVAKDRILARLRVARAAEAEAWERDRPAREARARAQEQDVADLQRRNRDREAEAAGERERAARMEAEQQAEVRAQAERQTAEAEKERQRGAAKRMADRQAQEKVDAETVARMRHEEDAALATDPCNRVDVRRQLMDAANTMVRGRLAEGKLLDLTRGRTNPAEPNATRACLFIADWSLGQRGLVTITVRKNSFGDDLIEVRPF